jgi:3-methylcrotonyl-CoA carboxylase alpha subunit
VQRRHQKVLEEAPAPGMDAARRKEMGEAAVAAARAIRYGGAGTVEFIAEQDGRFYFMEMNTRLQVEHPVTEMITGLDLVEWQIRVAAGERLPLSQEKLSFSGHAIEARIYAEDPDREFLPSTGRLVHLAFPRESAQVRVDAGVEAGGEITPWYDPMIAKLIVHGPDRASALATLRRALAETEIAGVTTNVAFLGRVAASRAFSAPELDTGLIERNRAELFPPRGPVPREMLEAAAHAELAAEEDAAREQARASGDPYSPWGRADGWRLNGEAHHDFTFVDADERHTFRISFADRPSAASRQARTVRDGRDWHVFWNGLYRKLSLKEELAAPEEERRGSLAAPMPGKVIQVLVEAGARVKKGEPLLILEAMKMEHTIAAPQDGTVKEIPYAAGEQVLEGAELIVLE